jgi:uncharacterized protein YggL (DUF469 family)
MQNNKIKIGLFGLIILSNNIAMEEKEIIDENEYQLKKNLIDLINPYGVGGALAGGGLGYSSGKVIESYNKKIDKNGEEIKHWWKEYHLTYALTAVGAFFGGGVLGTYYGKSEGLLIGEDIGSLKKKEEQIKLLEEELKDIYNNKLLDDQSKIIQIKLLEKILEKTKNQ